MEHSSRYIVLFAAAVCGVCSIFVATAAVTLKDRQEANKLLDVQKKVLVVAGLMQEGEDIDGPEVTLRFDENITAKVVDVASGEYAAGVDAVSFDQSAVAADLATSTEAPTNRARVRRVPNQALVYHVAPGGELRSIVLPIEGAGLWGTLYGFIAIGADGRTIDGITFYQHKETPGLGGEVDNPRWKALWKGRKAFDEKGDVRITVKKGMAGSPETDPYRVDGLSGATITSRSVTNLLAFWLGDAGFGPYMDRYRIERGI
ncbi:MAG: Na(+)-translocating NADH-quinone reductase subunit C [Deltaproteobacteria bacterium]|nr:Na(+)-translocating NADH-quinone reductase subunit C [Deltaproteobacteria bacterium]